jgi:hypothetical protein
MAPDRVDSYRLSHGILRLCIQNRSNRLRTSPSPAPRKGRVRIRERSPIADYFAPCAGEIHSSGGRYVRVVAPHMSHERHIAVNLRKCDQGSVRRVRSSVPSTSAERCSMDTGATPEVIVSTGQGSGGRNRPILPAGYAQHPRPCTLPGSRRSVPEAVSGIPSGHEKWGGGQGGATARAARRGGGRPPGRVGGGGGSPTAPGPRPPLHP